MITLTVDKKKVEMEEGSTVLQAAEKLGVHIPTLCHHKSLLPQGACRLCLVEVTAGGRPGLTASCAHTATDGLEVSTDSERVLKSRKLVIELLLLRSPEVPVLKKLAEDVGIDTTRFERFRTENEKCILCGLCLRVCEERMGVGAINFVNRGADRKVSTPYDKHSPTCITCGACQVVCPADCIDLSEVTQNKPMPIPSEFDVDLGERPSIHIPYPQAIPKVPVIDPNTCMHFKKGVCKSCENFCEAGAINYEQKDELKELNVGAIVLANGYDVFDAKRKAEYGFGRLPNVVTALQFERILSASGPYEGHLKRPGDGKTPKKIAWIQCVGSRDVTLGNDYCSSVCCMYSVKQAIIAKEHESAVETTIFYIDMRSFGKGFESFYNRAKNHYGVRFIRSQVSAIKEDFETGELLLTYAGEDKRITTENFDITVLSVGLEAHHAIPEVKRITGIQCDKFGFAKLQPYNQLLSNKEGIFLTGAMSGPKDIPETVQQSSAAAALVGEMLGSVRGTEIQVKEYPTERDISEEEPRIGVFVCHCGINISSVVDVTDVSEYVKSIPGVVYADHTLYTCSQDTQQKIKEVIKDKNLNRVIVASCTPRTHEPLFQETMREAGLNKFMFEMADIREQCSWVHQKEPEKATQKAKELVRGSVGKSKLLEPIQFKKVGITKVAMVVGGGLSGMTSALSLANQGFQVHLVEKAAQLGGNLVNVHRSLDGNDWQAYLADTTNKVKAHDKIALYLDSQVDQVTGFVGNFETTLTGGSQAQFKHGVIVIATGARESNPKEFLFGENDRVMSQWQLEKELEEGKTPESVVMIQCVGSRNEERPYCSRVCCGEAVKNALAIKEKNPQAKVTILYREIRTYEFKELYYRKARDLGVMFIHFPDDQYPEVREAGGKMSVTVRDTVLDRDINLEADAVVLSAAIEPDKDNNKRLSEMMKISLNEDNFFMEAHVKLRPVDFANEGIFVCGLAHSPKYTEENLSQALATAGRAACILSKDSLEVSGVVSVVETDKCATCLTCVRECVYDAPFVNAEGKAEIESVKCQGCGNCVSVCPAKAIQLRTFTDSQEKALFHSILKEPPLVKVES